MDCLRAGGGADHRTGGAAGWHGEFRLSWLGSAETRAWHIVDAAGAEVAALVPTEEASLFSVVVPANTNAGEYYFAVKRTPGGFFSSLDDTRWPVEVAGVQSRLFVETDKGLYTPGQTVLVRVLALTDRNTARKDIALAVTNPDGIKIAVLRNSRRAGVALFWLPLALELDFGSYALTATTDGAEANPGFEVDAYVLPKFFVNVTLNAKFLLRVTTSVTGVVAAKYTFGEPVRGIAQCSGLLNFRALLRSTNTI